MLEPKKIRKEKPLFISEACAWGSFLIACCIMSGVFISGCSEDKIMQTPDLDPLAAAGIMTIVPGNLADSVALDPIITVTFVAGTDETQLAATELTLSSSGTSIPGNETLSGTTATYTFGQDLAPMTEYTATVHTTKKNYYGKNESHDYSWRFRTGNHHRNKPLAVVSVEPANNTTSIPVTTNLKITMNQELTSQMQNMISVSLKKGYNAVQGNLTFDGRIVTFTPSNTLDFSIIYAARITFGISNSGGDDDDADDGDDKSGNSYSWSFTTAAGGSTVDNTAPTVNSVTPAGNATSVSTGTSVSATFSEAMDPVTVSATTFTLKQGTTPVAGAVSYASNAATFTPSAVLSAGLAYTATITAGVKDVAGNALASSYSWNFTTATAADVTPPAVTAVSPAANAISVAISSKVTVTFNEAMTASTITASTVTLKQGTASVGGSVTYSSTNNTATFTPTTSLTGSTVYTITVTTGVKDAAGNALASNYTSGFTTVAVSAGLSFATDVMPVLTKCNTCHTHNWTTSANASTFYTNLVNANYVNPTTPASSKIYSQINSGHPSSTVTAAEKTRILTWMTEGSKNN